MATAHTEKTTEDLHETMTDIKSSAAELRADFDHLRSDLRELMKIALKEGKAGASAAKERLSEGAGEMKDELAEAWNRTREQGAEAVKSFGKTVVDNPLTSLSVAVGAGLILGVLLRRK